MSIEKTHDILHVSLPGSLPLGDQRPPKVTPALVRSLYVVDIVFLSVVCRAIVSVLASVYYEAMRHAFNIILLSALPLMYIRRP